MDQSNNAPIQNDSVKTAILEVSRDLFAKFGYKKTTMEDIAHALGKGKSSLYYYFKNKEEIFQAVIDWEEDILFSRLKDVVSLSVSAAEKIKKYVEVRMETIRELENYHKALKIENTGGFDFLSHIKGRSEKEEAKMLEEIIIEGINTSLFTIKNSHLAAISISVALKGLEEPLFRSMNLEKLEDFKIQLENILNILFYGILKRE